MFDFRLKVFFHAANRLSFTKASQELHITQPAVSKHIKEIENYFKIKLFERSGTKITLTSAGEILLQHTKELFSFHKSIEFEMNTLAKVNSGHLRIGASKTVSQYLLPSILASFHQKFKQIRIELVSKNTEQIEKDLREGIIDIGLIEGDCHNLDFQYTPFMNDELVLTCNTKNSLSNKNIKPKDLAKYSYLMREPGSGSLEVLANALKKININISDLSVEMQLDNIESMKLYLANSNALVFLSVSAIFKELNSNEFSIIDIDGFSIERKINFIQTQGSSHSLASLFMKFALAYNLK